METELTLDYYVEGEHRAARLQLPRADTDKLQIPDELSDDFRSAVDKLKARARRQELIENAALTLARQIIYYLDDRDGFNGESRAAILMRPEAKHYLKPEDFGRL